MIMLNKGDEKKKSPKFTSFSLLLGSSNTFNNNLIIL